MTEMIEMKALVDNSEDPSGDEEESSVESEHEAAVTKQSELLVRRLLYASHFAAQFSEVMWQFLVAIFLAACTRYQSLILVSTYGLSLNLAVSLTGARLGRWLDQTNRISSARRLIALENLAVILGTACCYILLLEGPDEEESDAAGKSHWLADRFAHVPSSLRAILALLGIHFFGSAAQVLDQAFLVSIERDWVVVLSLAFSPRGDEQAQQQNLSELNVTMKQIDLTCKVAAPGVSGLLLSQFLTNSGSAEETSPTDLQRACLVVGILNAMALMVEYVCTAIIYSTIPDLAHKKNSCDDSRKETDDDNLSQDESSRSSDPTVMSSAEPSCSSLCLPLGLDIYLQQPVCKWGGLSLAILYMNALTFGNGIMTAYLLHRGLRVELVGMLRGIASAIGLLGTVAYHLSAKVISLETTGMWSVAYQCCCMGFVVASTFISSDNLAVAFLVGGICLSRIGLWVFDIAVTQLQQQEIPEDVRGVVGGVQQALNAFFTFLSFGLGVAFPDPNDFFFFALAGFLSVASAMVLFGFGIYYPRRRLML